MTAGNRLAALLFATLAGCGTTVVEGPVRIGQLASVGGPRVRPDRVIEDSRCPVGATCVQAGRVVLRATVYGGTWSRRVDLPLGVPVVIADGTLTLVAVTPARGVGRRAPSRFAFVFRGGL